MLQGYAIIYKIYGQIPLILTIGIGTALVENMIKNNYEDYPIEDSLLYKLI